MSETKTKPSDESVEEFLYAVDHPQKKAASFELVKLMKEVTPEEPIMWGTSIIGFGSYYYRYASGHEGDWPMVGFPHESGA